MPTASTPARAIQKTVERLVRLYYPTIEVRGADHIPPSGPVLLVANHANSLLDPVVVTIAASRPVRFLAKAPLFEVPVLGRIMDALGMVPAFRAIDGAAQVRRNLDSIAEAARYLVDGDALGIFPEGRSHDDLHVEMIRSGAARMALSAFHQGARELLLVPVGLNYQQKERFRSAVWIEIGRPLELKSFLAGFSDDRTAQRALTRDIERRLREVVIHFDEPDWQRFLPCIEVLVPPTPQHTPGPLSALRRRKTIADAVNFFFTRDRPRSETLGRAIDQHARRLTTLGLSLDSPPIRSRGIRLALELAGSTARLASGALPALCGTVHHLVPFVIVRTACRALRMPGRMTVSLYRLLFGVPVYLVWYVAIWFALADYFRPWVAWTWTLLMPFAGAHALGFWSRARDLFRTWSAEFLILFRGVELDRFRRRHEQLSSEVVQLAKEFRQARGEVASPELNTHVEPAGYRLACTLLLSAIALLLILVAPGPRDRSMPAYQAVGLDLARAHPVALDRQLTRDESALFAVLEALESSRSNSSKLAREFESGTRSFYRPDEAGLVRRSFLGYLNHRAALLRILWRYQNYSQLADPTLRMRAFLLAAVAGTRLFDASSEFVHLWAANPDAVRKLNEPEPSAQLPSGSFDFLAENLEKAGHRRLVQHAFATYDQSVPVVRRLAESRPSLRRLAGELDRARTALARTLEPATALSIAPDAFVIRSSETAYRARSLIAAWIGDTRIRQPRDGQPLIQPAQLGEFARLLRPGDILLERRNWFLSNAFLPGYWPHSALYIGTPEDLRALGLDQDPRVKPHWNRFVRGDAAGHSYVVLEAVSEGVIFNTLEHSVGGADSAAALRPRLSRADLRECIARAFTHIGKPYDFEFDFLTADKLVCTELVYRSFAGNLDFQLTEILGTRTMPALELVRKFHRESVSETPQLGFVCFLDGIESGGRAEFRSPEEFMATLERPALTWLQQAQ